MVQSRLGEQVDHPAGSAGLRVRRAKDHSPEARMHQRHRTHRAGFQRHEQLAFGQPVVRQQGRGMTQRDNFSVSRGIVRGDRPVVAGGDHPALAQDHSADRHLADEPCVVRLVQGQAHRVFVGWQCRHVGSGLCAHAPIIPWSASFPFCRQWSVPSQREKRAAKRSENRAIPTDLPPRSGAQRRAHAARPEA